MSAREWTGAAKLAECTESASCGKLPAGSGLTLSSHCPETHIRWKHSIVRFRAQARLVLWRLFVELFRLAARAVCGGLFAERGAQNFHRAPCPAEGGRRAALRTVDLPHQFTELHQPVAGGLQLPAQVAVLFVGQRGVGHSQLRAQV